MDEKEFSKMMKQSVGLQGYIQKTHWLNSDQDFIEIKYMEPNQLYISALEVIRKNYTEKEEWLQVFIKYLKKKGRDDLITKLMLRGG